MTYAIIACLAAALSLLYIRAHMETPKPKPVDLDKWRRFHPSDAGALGQYIQAQPDRGLHSAQVAKVLRLTPRK